MENKRKLTKTLITKIAYSKPIIKVKSKIKSKIKQASRRFFRKYRIPFFVEKQVALNYFLFSHYLTPKYLAAPFIYAQRLKRALRKLKTVPYIKKRFNKNTKFVTTQFYHFWFSQIKKRWWHRRWVELNHKVTLNAVKWQLFRFARHYRKARYWRNSVGFNWAKAIQVKNEVNNANKINLLSKQFLKLNALIKKHLYILTNSALISKFAGFKIKRRLTLLKKKRKAIKYLIFKLILNSSNEKRMNLYYNLYSKFGSGKHLTTFFYKKLSLFRPNLKKRYLMGKLNWPVLHNKFPNYAGSAKSSWYDTQVKRMLKFNYERYNIIYRLFSKRRVKLIYKPSWINWTLTKKFRNLRRWKREKYLFRSGLTRKKLKYLLVFNSRRHFRLVPNKRKSYSLIISTTSSNFFINVVRSKTGSPIKVFSGGTMKMKTHRLRRSFSTFVKAFVRVIKFLKIRHIYRLKFIKFIQDSVNPSIRITIKNIRFILKLFKDSNLKRIKRWIFENKTIHSLPLRGPKLRRK